LRIEFLPEPNAAAGISRQIRASGRAYPVFGTAKLFLERPERHRVRVISENPEVPLFQIGEGPISFDRAAVERNAFLEVKSEYYREETAQGEPIKGNFSNVARVRATGALLAPTNYHGYQPALRKLYEERFSRRMSFPEFQQHEIEIVSDEQAVADWKEQARSSTTFVTVKETEPVTFKSAFDAEQHFRKQYLPQLVKTGTKLECSGQASRSAADRHVAGAVRNAWETESHFPQQIVNGLRSYFMEAGLHYFKHRKRVLYVSATKPLRHPQGQVFSDGITSILQTVEANPRIKRPDLAKRILGEQHDTPEMAARKEQLASDLHYLIHAGHVIEFSNGMLEMPLAPQDKPGGQGRPAPTPATREAAGAPSASEEAIHDEAPAEEEVTDESAGGPAETAVETAHASISAPSATPEAEPAEVAVRGAVEVPESSASNAIPEPTIHLHAVAEASNPELAPASVSSAAETETPVPPTALTEESSSAAVFMAEFAAPPTEGSMVDAPAESGAEILHHEKAPVSVSTHATAAETDGEVAAAPKVP
jgi:hypothetical protein